MWNSEEKSNYKEGWKFMRQREKTFMEMNAGFIKSKLIIPYKHRIDVGLCVLLIFISANDAR